MTNEQKAKAWFDEWDISGVDAHYDKANLQSFAAFCLDKREILPEAAEEQWASLNHTLLVSFLHLPEEHQIHLMESILLKRPKLIETLNASKGE